jgi:hypothetical protein
VTVVSENPAVGDDGMLLSCIARMPRLQQLVLSLRNFDWPDDEEVYSALTASSNLQHLELADQNLPGGIWQEMFPLGKTWPFLQVGAIPHDAQRTLGHARSVSRQSKAATPFAELHVCCSGASTMLCGSVLARPSSCLCPYCC